MRTSLKFLYKQNILQEKWGIDSKDILDEAISRCYREFGKYDERVVFLYSKQVHQYCPNKRIKIEDIEGSVGDRIRRLLCGDYASNNVPITVQTFNDFLRKIPAWNTGFIFHRDHPNVSSRNIMLQRCQTSGLCYMHAPVVVQHYNCCMNNTAYDDITLDIGEYTAERLAGAALYEHLFENKGGNSRDFLKSILEENSIIETTEPVTKEILLKYGPCLLSQFRVADKFKDINTTSHIGRTNITTNDRHAMVIIGIREDYGKQLFLLQNWWAKKQFVEVDWEYINSCDGIATRIITPQNKIPSNKIVHATYSETAADTAENLHLETYN